MKKGVLRVALVCCLAIVAIVGVIGYQWKKERNRSGILLAFDDYSPDNWESYFDLFDKYGVKVSFFINAEEPTDFCANAVARGHEIGFHGAEHVRMTEISEEEIIEYAIEPIEVFRQQGYELTSFAYPYGEYTDELNALLLQHYNVVRGAYFYALNPKENLQKGFVESMSIDNVNYESDQHFQETVDMVLSDACRNKGTVVSIYSHAIDGGNWCVAPDRLEYIFQKAEELGLEFYTFKNLQK